MRWLCFLSLLVCFTTIFHSIAYSEEYVCNVHSLVTADAEETRNDVAKYLKMKNIRSKSKFVFDITDDAIVVNGEEYKVIYTSGDKNYFMYSSNGLVYVIFHFYKQDSKIIITGMQNASSDTFLRSEVLNCSIVNAVPKSSAVYQHFIPEVPLPVPAAVPLPVPAAENTVVPSTYEDTSSVSQIVIPPPGS